MAGLSGGAGDIWYAAVGGLCRCSVTLPVTPAGPANPRPVQQIAMHPMIAASPPCRMHAPHARARAHTSACTHKHKHMRAHADASTPTTPGTPMNGQQCPTRSHIKFLDISWNTLGRRGGQALGEGLREASSIQELYLAWTGITDRGASHIARVRQAGRQAQPARRIACPAAQAGTSQVMHRHNVADCSVSQPPPPRPACMCFGVSRIQKGLSSVAPHEV